MIPLRFIPAYGLRTPNGTNGKKSRDVDVVSRDANGNIVEYHQVGRQTAGGKAVSRERKAMDDIEGATKTRPEFHPYN